MSILADVKFTPSGGSEIVLDHVPITEPSVTRRSGDDGRIATVYHEIGDLQVEVKPAENLDAMNALLKLQAASGEEAIFGGEITVYNPEDTNQPLRVLRFQHGHIAARYPNEHADVWEVALADLQVNDASFARGPAPRAGRR